MGHAASITRLATGPGRMVVVRNYLFRAHRMRGDRIKYTDREGISYLLDTHDWAVSRHIYSHRGFESKVRRQILDVAGWQPGRVFIDIGANLGMTTAAAIICHGASNVVAFEPDQTNLELLRATLDLNGIADQVDVYPVALSSESGTAHLTRNQYNPGDHHLGHDGDPVDVSRLDDYRIDYDDVGVVWLDVQGHEGHALAGARQLLESNVPVVVEFSPSMLNRTEGGMGLLLDVVARHFSTVVDIRGGRTLPVTDISTLVAEYPGDRYTDLVLLR